MAFPGRTAALSPCPASQNPLVEIAHLRLVLFDGNGRARIVCALAGSHGLVLDQRQQSRARAGCREKRQPRADKRRCNSTKLDRSGIHGLEISPAGPRRGKPAPALIDKGGDGVYRSLRRRFDVQLAGALKIQLKRGENPFWRKLSGFFALAARGAIQAPGPMRRKIHVRRKAMGI